MRCRSMSNWEYKVISSGRGGFATPALLEKFLNDLGRENWEIIEFRTLPDNALAFSGLARRSTQRDWTLEDAAAAAAKAEAEKLRAEFEAKFKAATSSAPAEEPPASFLDEKVAPDDGFRKPIDTSRDSDPDAPEDEGEKDEWDKLAEEDELPTFFDALKPHMRRNQRGPGQSVGIDYLAKKWGLAEEDIKGALVECGLQIPADENAKPVYVEFDGDLFWVNINRRGELWINTREKPRPVFRVVQGQRVADEDAPEAREQKSGNGHERKSESVRHREPQASPQPEMPAPAEGAATPAADTPSEALPPGPALLEKIRPHMRRNRRGPGGSGSVSFLSRALRCSDADLMAGFAALGLAQAENDQDKPAPVEISGHLWWLNQDSRGGVWINAREKRDGDTAKSAEAAEPATSASARAESAASGESTSPAPVAEAASPAEAAIPAPAASESPAPAASTTEAPAVASAPAAGDPTLTAVRLLLKETKTGSVAARLENIAESLGRHPEELLSALKAAGLKVPEKPREKPVFVPLGDEIVWINRNSRDELWINAKASKFADSAEESDEAAGEKKPRRPRGRRKSDDTAAPFDPAAGEPAATDNPDAAPSDDTPPAPPVV